METIPIETIWIVFFILLILYTIPSVSSMKNSVKEGLDSCTPDGNAVTQKQYNVLSNTLNRFSGQLNELSADVAGMQQLVTKIESKKTNV